MPARDLYHDAVIRALVADGWEITHDPLTLSFGGRDLYVDLGATHVAIGAERIGRVIVSSETMRLVVFDDTNERIVRWGL